MYFYIYALKQEKLEMDDFEREKNVVSKGKILWTFENLRKYYEKVLTDTHAKKFTEYLCIILCFKTF